MRQLLTATLLALVVSATLVSQAVIAAGVLSERMGR